MRGYEWEKRGQLITAPTELPWAATHAALPCAANADSESLDIYYSPRDEQGRAHVARAHVSPIDGGAGLKLIGSDPHPVLSPGMPGAFDESGTTVACIVDVDGDMFLYYTGWTLGVTVPFYFYVGLAIRRRGESTFSRASEAPILERDAIDPYLTASPWVLREGDLWRMWYVSCCRWHVLDGSPQHQYHIRYAESDDGIRWRREGRVSIDFAHAGEYAISRPCVVHDDDCYRMWFSARGERYRLGYAESPDGFDWTRADSLGGLEPSNAGWDADMIAYPAVVDHGEQRYLFYNGNDYGRTGIGYAIGTAI